ncbi:EndoU domain-containing protein [Lysobacter capsici]|nr:EndoU domain-containing protein [Lysobacter capsici]
MGVYEGTVELEVAPNVWQLKGGSGRSSFFPTSWSRNEVMYESVQGFRTRQYLNPNSPSAWSSITPSGVMVRGYDSPKLTIYPVR